MPGIDLTNARARVRDLLLVDRCTIKRNPLGWANTRFDEESGDYVTGPGGEDPDTELLASAVPCAARDESLQERDAGEGGAYLAGKLWRVKLDYALSPEELLIGDILVFTVAADPMLLGIELFVTRVFTGTLRVFRVVQAARRVR